MIGDPTGKTDMRKMMTREIINYLQLKKRFTPWINRKLKLLSPNEPQREVAKKLNISRSYISRIEKRAIEKARENLNKDDFFTD